MRSRSTEAACSITHSRLANFATISGASAYWAAPTLAAFTLHQARKGLCKLWIRHLNTGSNGRFIFAGEIHRKLEVSHPARVAQIQIFIDCMILVIEFDLVGLKNANLLGYSEIR